MASILAVQQSRVIPIGVDDAFAGTLPIPLTTIFRRWYGPIPPVAEVREQEGEWGTPGQIRVVAFKGPGEMREKLISVDPPRSFGYRLSEVTGPMALLVDHIIGEWIFAPAAAGTEITWRWDIRPRSAMTAWALPLLGSMWKSYARRALRDLSALLTG